MKHFIPFVLLLFSIQISSAQDLKFSADTLYLTGDPNNFEVVGHAYVINLTNQMLAIRWEKEDISFAQDWEAAICDNNNCYGTNVNSNVDPALPIDIPVMLEPGDTSIIDVHLYPHGERGLGYVNVVITPADNPTIVYGEMYYIFNVGAVSSVSELYLPEYNVFPNPVLDYFQLTNDEFVDKVELYNALGRKVNDFTATPKERYNIANLPGGLYLANLKDKSGKTIQTVRLIKRTVRP